MLDVSEDDDLRECFNWKNTQPLSIEFHKQKGVINRFLDYQLQFIRAYQYFKLNNEGHSKNFH